MLGRLRRAARLLRCAQQLRDHAIVIEQRRIVFLAEVADPGGATLRGELLLHLVVLVVERILVLGKAQAVVRVRAQQMHDDEFALLRAGQRGLDLVQQHPVQRFTGAPRRVIDELHHIGQFGVLLLDGQIILVADPPDLVARGSREGQQMLGRQLVLRREVEHLVQRGQRAGVHRPGVAQHQHLVSGLSLQRLQLRRGGARIAVERQVVAVHAFSQHQHHGARLGMGGELRGQLLGVVQCLFPLFQLIGPLITQMVDRAHPAGPESDRVQPPPGLARVGEHHQREQQDQHHLHRPPVSRWNPARISGAHGRGPGQTCGDHQRAAPEGQRAPLRHEVFAALAQIGVGGGGEHQGPVGCGLVGVLQIAAGHAVQHKQHDPQPHGTGAQPPRERALQGQKQQDDQRQEQHQYLGHTPTLVAEHDECKPQPAQQQAGQPWRGIHGVRRRDRGGRSAHDRVVPAE